MRKLAKNFGECIRIQEYETETEEGHLKGSPKRKIKLLRSTTVDPETGKVVREFDSPTYVFQEYDSAFLAGQHSASLTKNGIMHTVHYVSDGRSGGNEERSLPPDLNLQFIQGVLHAS